MNTPSELSWEDAQMFLAVAEHGSFSAAAFALRVGQATVSRRVAQLEEQLGGVLFVRGRRGTALTPLGQRMLPAAQQMSRWAAELRAAIASEEQSVRGKVTLASATGVASQFLIPFAAKLGHERPELRLELRTGVDYVDLTRGEADIALRARVSTDPALVTIASVQVPMYPYASPHYLKRFVGKTLRPEDVDWIGWDAARAHLFPHPLLSTLIEGFEPRFAADEYLLQVQACEQGVGVMMMPGTRHPLMKVVEVERVSMEMPVMQGELCLVCAKSMRFVPRVRAVIDALLEALESLEMT